MIYGRERHVSALLADHHHVHHVVRSIWRKYTLSIEYTTFFRIVISVNYMHKIIIHHHHHHISVMELGHLLTRSSLMIPSTTWGAVFHQPGKSMYVTAEVLSTIYDRNTKWIPKGTVMHGSNILP